VDAFCNTGTSHEANTVLGVLRTDWDRMACLDVSRPAGPYETVGEVPQRLGHAIALLPNEQKKGRRTVFVSGGWESRSSGSGVLCGRQPLTMFLLDIEDALLAISDPGLEARQDFQNWDSNGDGVLSYDEVHRRLVIEGWDDAHILQLLQHLDADHNGLVSLDEFVQAAVLSATQRALHSASCKLLPQSQNDPPERAFHSCTGFEEMRQLFVYGGTDSHIGTPRASTFDDLWRLRYRFGDYEWDPCVGHGLKPPGRFQHASARVGNHLLIHGGRQHGDPRQAPGGAFLLDDLWIIEVAGPKPTCSWAQVWTRGSPLPPLCKHSMVNFDYGGFQKIFLCGGNGVTVDPQDFLLHLNDLYEEYLKDLETS